MAWYRGKSGGGTLTETELWTNASPTATFASQVISLSDDINNYDYIAFELKATTATQTSYRVIYPTAIIKQSSVAEQGFAAELAGTVVNNIGFVRAALYDTDTTMQFDVCYRVGSTGSNNNYVIPLKIIGLK